MKLTTFGELAWKHTRNAFAESMYLNTKKDVTRPVSVYGIVNEKCNYKCRYCEYWRLKEYVDELSIDEWKEALTSLKEFLGSYHIEFSGGEPFIKKGFVDLVEWCHEAGIKWGVTTNGSALTKKNVERVVAAHPFNINISMDSHDPEVHNYARGVEGSLEKITKYLRFLIEERNRVGQDFPIIIKPVVHKLNFRTLPAMVQWTKELGANVINFQPIDRWTKETYDELWIEKEDHEELGEIAAKLLDMKRAGEPIMNSELILKNWVKHFREEPAPPETMPCRVGLRNYFIRTNGDVEVCWFYPPIGNVRDNSAQEIWHSYEAKQRRKETTACDRLCLFTCLSQKTLLDKAKMALTIFKKPQAPTRTGPMTPEELKAAAVKTNVSLPVVNQP